MKQTKKCAINPPHFLVSSTIFSSENVTITKRQSFIIELNFWYKKTKDERQMFGNRKSLGKTTHGSLREKNPDSKD